MKKILLMLGILSILLIAGCQKPTQQPINNQEQPKSCEPSKYDLRSCPEGYRLMGSCLRPNDNPTDCGENLCYKGLDGWYSCCAKGIVC